MWFAFKFCSLFLQTQCISVASAINSGCDLLSNFVLYFYKHNMDNLSWSQAVVVICFQILFFIFTNTILPSAIMNRQQLWFAFKFCSLFLQTQLNGLMLLMQLCCDLLSNFVLYFYKHNSALASSCLLLVVICFQILFFIFTNTILFSVICKPLLLWFAFKFCSLFLQTQ